MPNKDQSKRYKELPKNQDIKPKTKKTFTLKNWQKISIIVILLLLCIVAIVATSYLLIFK